MALSFMLAVESSSLAVDRVFSNSSCVSGELQWGGERREGRRGKKEEERKERKEKKEREEREERGGEVGEI